MATYPPNTNNLVPSTTPGPGFQGENAYGMTPTTNATGIVLQRLCVQLLRYGSFLDDRSKPRNSFLAEWDRDVPAINLSSVFSDNDLVELETGRAEQRQTSLSWIDLNARHAARRSIPFQAVASLSQPSTSQSSMPQLSTPSQPSLRTDTWITLRAYSMWSILLFPIQFILAIIFYSGASVGAVCVVGFALEDRSTPKVLASVFIGVLGQIFLIYVWTNTLGLPSLAVIQTVIPFWWRTSWPILRRLVAGWLTRAKQAMLWPLHILLMFISFKL